MKICNTCKKEKTEDQFVKWHKTKDGLTYDCRECRAINYKKWYDNNPTKVKEKRRLEREYRKDYYNSPDRKLKYRQKYIEKKFEIPYSEYNKMFEEQKGVCAICSKPETSSKCTYLSIDHDHSTMKIRGLLCVSCNRGLGMFWDNPELLQNAINYLNRNL
jgi:Recombination endonuclease VII